jgi:splicing factor 3A subunit 3
MVCARLIGDFFTAYPLLLSIGSISRIRTVNIMETIIEQQRRLHEEIERLELIGSRILVKQPRIHKEKLAMEHRLRDVLNRIQSASQQLFDLYEDKDNLRKEEIDAFSPPNEFDEFYRRLKAIEEYGRKFPDASAESLELELSGLEDIEAEQQKLESSFSGEEAYGKFLDLHAYHERYLNLKAFPKHVIYLRYLDEFDRFSDMRNDEKNVTYRDYLEDLAKYLCGFIERTQPLFNMKQFDEKMKTDFQTTWKQQPVSQTKESIVDGLYCVDCDKTFAKDTVFKSHLTGKKHIKNTQKHQERSSVSEMRDEDVVDERAVAYLEYSIGQYGKLLGKKREETKINIERKQSRTSEERLEDLEAIEEAIEEVAENEEEQSEDEEKPIYNPLKLPLGWDGKPIPYWLYKLHGLGIEYKCEICGGYTYMGRKSFERHFEEWRHTYGLKCLGIVNSSQFREITSIQDAVALRERLERTKQEVTFRPDVEEEFEDQQGNVFNKKTYEDLVRQGLL